MQELDLYIQVKTSGYDELGINAGLINRFRLSSALDLNVELRGLLMKGAFGNSGPKKDWLV